MQTWASLKYGKLPKITYHLCVVKNKYNNMKKLIYVLLLVVIAGTSCKKDKINNPQDLIKRLQKGVWQFDRATENGTSRTIETFNALKFESSNTVRIYFTRTEAGEPIYFRVKDIDGNYHLYIYETKTGYDRDLSESAGIVKYSNDEFTWGDETTTAVYKNYSSMDKTKDLPRGSM